MGIQAINDIVNEVSFKKPSMTMIRNSKSLCNDDEAEAGAERYIKLLNAPECRNFFLKVMYHLPYDIRERCLEMSRRKGVASPKRYFTHSAKVELSKLGY